MLKIASIGHAHPKVTLTNQFIEDLDVGTNAEWIETKIGIKERKISLDLDYIAETRNLEPWESSPAMTTDPTKLGLVAIEMALDRAGLKASDIGMIICNCCTPQNLAPTEAQRLMSALKIDVPSYEVLTACPAFALHMDYLNNFQEEKLPDYVLCVSTATLSQHVDYNNRSDGAIWGDGASAIIVTPRKEGKLSLLFSTYVTDPLRSQAVVVNTLGHFAQDGRAIRDFSVRQTVRLIKQIENEFEIDWTRDVFIGHQANQTMLEQITRNRGISEENHWYNVDMIGNQAGAGSSIVLSMHWDQ